MNKFHFLILWNSKSIINHLPKSLENFCIIFQNKLILAVKLLIYMGRNGFHSVMNLISISLFAWIHSSNSSLLELNYSHVLVEQAHNLHLDDNKVPFKGRMWNVAKIIGKATLPVKNINNKMLHSQIKYLENFIHRLVVNLQFLRSNLSDNLKCFVLRGDIFL